MNWKDLTLKSAKTFLQSFTAVLIAAGAGYLNIATVKAAAVAGLAALLSLVNNWASNAEINVLANSEGTK